MGAIVMSKFQSFYYEKQQENIDFTKEFILYMHSQERQFEPDTLTFIQDDETCIWVNENGNTVAEIFVNKKLTAEYYWKLKLTLSIIQTMIESVMNFLISFI